MLRRAMPFLAGMKHASPISQSAASAVLFSCFCLTRMPKTSERCSFRAPDSPSYSRLLLWSVMPCCVHQSGQLTKPCGATRERLALTVNSCPTISSALAKLPKVTPSPSPYTICSQPSFLLTCHTALAYLLLKCTELLTLALRPSTEAYPNTSQKKFRTTRVLSWTSLTAVSLTAALPSG